MRIFLAIIIITIQILTVSSVQHQPMALADNPSQDNTFTLGDTVEGDLTPAEVDTWVFQAEQGQRVVISAERFPSDPTSELDPFIELYTPSGQLWASDDNRGAGKDALLLGVFIPESGEYSVEISSKNAEWANGTYQLATAVDTLPEDCDNWEGEILTYDWTSYIAGGEQLQYRVYMPPCHDLVDIEYPYVILMHGSDKDDRHWDNLGIDDALMRGVALGRYPPMAIVMPFGGTYANTNIFGVNNSYEWMILNELMPLVQRQLCLQTTQDGRAIGGISRGGFWAFEIGFRHQELFSAIGGHSPFFDLYHAPDDFNPLALAQSVTWDAETSPRIYIDRGRDDYAQVNIELMVDRLTENNIEHIYDLYSVGQHRDDYWGSHVDDYLEFYTENWNIEDYPSCERASSSTAE